MMAPRPLAVYTARIGTRDPDRFDVTRRSAGPEGLPFAPSWDILRPALDARRQAEQLRAGGHLAGADAVEAAAWATYEPLYREEMRASYRKVRPAWDALLARRRAVLCCYCVDPAHCHRRLLAAILVTLGAEDRGEVGASQMGLFQ